MVVPFLDLKAQYRALKPQMDAAIQSVLDRSAFILGPELEEFERAFAAYIGTKHGIGVSTGTDALELALRACGIGLGDEVITVPDTFIATTEAISCVGGKIKWVDVHSRTYNMDPAGLDAAVSRCTKAIIPVHLYGQPADMDAIMRIARRHKLRVIEDCAQAHGATYSGHKVGTFGDVGCFSFYPGKNLGAYGDAGAVVTNDDGIAARVRLLRHHGQQQKNVHNIEGFCRRLDNLQAAVLNVKLSHLDAWNAGRRSRARLYDGLLKDVPGIVTPFVAPENVPVYHLYVIRVTDGRRDALQAHLSQKGIATGLHYPIPLHLQPAYASAGHKAGDFPVSEQLASQGLSLPMFPELTDDQVHYVADNIKEFMIRPGSTVFSSENIPIMAQPRLVAA
jgi:dTDP-4-amino-4,6-dideoxygalactose transaminase